MKLQTAVLSALVATALVGCESQVDKQSREFEEANKRSRERAAEQARNTPEAEKEKLRKQLQQGQAQIEKKWQEKKAFSLAVAQGKEPRPPAKKPSEFVTKPTPIVNGACPAYDNLKIGTIFSVTPEISQKYGLPEGRYTLDPSCKPLLTENATEQQERIRKEASFCGAPFYSFEVNDVITIDKDEQKYFGYPPGTYRLKDQCIPALVSDEKKYSSNDREQAYKDASERRLSLIKASMGSSIEETEKQRNAGQLQTLGSKTCPQPYQRYSPGQTVPVRIESGIDILATPGDWFIDGNCNPHWYGPVRVSEPKKMAEIKANTLKSEKTSRMIVIGGVMIALLGFIEYLTRRITGRSLYTWLRSSKN